MLHAPQDPIELRQFARRFARQADEAVQLIDRAVGFDAQVVLRQPLAAGEAGLARVAAPRVDAVDGDARLIESSSLTLILSRPRQTPFHPRHHIQKRRGYP